MKTLLTFGDSFSDNGFSNGCGYNRLSNGPVWVEYLAQMLGASLEDRAWCGATSGHGNASGPKDWSGLAWQVDTYSPTNSETNRLCTLLIGINDVYDGTGTAKDSVANIIRAIETLNDKGIHRFLISNVPDITHAPAYAEEYAPLKKTVQNTLRTINEHLEQSLTGPNGLLTRLPDITLYPVLNAYDIFNALVADSRFANTREPWNGTYSDPNTTGYMWWDDWHPTTETHKAFAKEAFKIIESGPIRRQA
ncbi:hypothetical protein GO013_03075 [Pseudodesulfovibrio sp. JC047]|uniref:SGNH/GDSL hydrolase family protein n=1 Tax=Pseudodesulfovibrio sp. JC047 TaxID=2683199 RepID=UPI0013D5D644|nr:SGNH/GDSL hydrolase family protein [Pseudodesulfovibrio sp. JC047]NDV18400.1 hypothetical protein [Pseudodesulfovibrio sp. JC047]